MRCRDSQPAPNSYYLMSGSYYIEPGSQRRVLYPFEFSDSHGGAQQSLVALLRHLDMKAWQPVVLMPRGGDMLSQLEDLQVEVEQRGGWHCWRHASLRHTPLVVASLAHWIRSTGPYDIIHSNMLPSLLLCAGIKPLLSGARLVWHDRGNAEYTGRTLWLLRWGIDRADRIIATTNICKQRWVERGVDADKISVVPNGTDLELDADVNSAPDTRQPKADRPTVVNVSRITPLKEIETFIRAVADVRENVPDVHAIIVGGIGKLPSHAESDQAYLNTLHDLERQLSLKEHITWLGAVSQEEVKRTLSRAHVVVGTSRLESFGRVYIEAAMLGKPVVATRVGGVPDVVLHGETGLLFERGDARGIASGITRLLQNPSEAQELGARAQRRACARYTASGVAKQIEAVYAETLR